VRTFDFASLWTPELNPLETVLRAALVYLLVQLVFRVAGRKAFQRWGPPEIALLFLVSTAVRKSIVVDDESITTALLALVTIAALDRFQTTLSARWRKAADVIEGPVLQLVRDGKLDRAAMRRVRIGEHELLARVRAKGRERVDEIRDAYFERSGEVTIVFKG
jgi:uncharacterized membrane protein YcaP (DUF421 family)